jgi:hypothetical protein
MQLFSVLLLSDDDEELMLPLIFINRNTSDWYQKERIIESCFIYDQIFRENRITNQIFRFDLFRQFLVKIQKIFSN